MSVTLSTLLSRPAMIWAVSCTLCFGALAEMMIDNEGAIPKRPIVKAKLEAKLDDFV